MKQALSVIVQSLRTVVRDMAGGFFVCAHSGFALLGLATVFVVLTLVVRPDLRASSQQRLASWLESHPVVAVAQSAQNEIGASVVDDALEVSLDTSALAAGALARTTAENPRNLPRQQAALAYWLSKRYRVAVEPVSALVAEAYDIGKRTQLDPTLILSVMAIESNFNPFAQSHAGAQGLMQVITHIHHQKYESQGGALTAFDPVTNMRVGARVLQECIRLTGSVEGGLRYYVGAANRASDGGYVTKVMAVYAQLQRVASEANGGKFSHPAASMAAAAPQPSQVFRVGRHEASDLTMVASIKVDE
ncbi:MAG: lytic transglycosylase domain-containing protein [Burkholderiaceae bacterium]|jgi:soluble lytic murein transglycosylase-like protein|nr:lytic transglycosylase domain-containing protein [Burkholderiaceae bacterium]